MTTESLVTSWNELIAGNEEAYKKLVVNLTNQLFGYGCCFINDDDFIKECIGDVFFELWKKRDQIKQTTDPKQYFFKALRQCIFKKHTRWERAEVLDGNYEFTIEFELQKDVIDLRTRVRLEELATNLSPRQREFIYLRFYEKFDKKAIVEIMQLKKQANYKLILESIFRLKVYANN